ncbi:dicarboxylate/amino acid:cation symporter [Zobellella sp. An-6]|uniref:dicarboxylate/amino acid:cation symporter n=1 Tax=Zobellella sp. An-6 TaxID=3400218 RepID=UPI004041BA57
MVIVCCTEKRGGRVTSDDTLRDLAIAGFGVPLGATINMSGSAIYITLAAIFAANISGTPIATGDLLTVGVTVLLMSIGVGGVPGGAVVMAGVLLHQMGLPVEAMAIIMAVDRINDMFCTASNVVGDTAVNTIVARMEGNPDSLEEATGLAPVQEK